MTFQVIFDDNRLGRRHDVQPQTFNARDAGDLPGVIYSFVRKHLLSSGVEVSTYDDGTGTVTVGGFRQVGSFRFHEVTP